MALAVTVEKVSKKPVRAERSNDIGAGRFIVYFNINDRALSRLKRVESGIKIKAFGLKRLYKYRFNGPVREGGDSVGSYRRVDRLILIKILRYLRTVKRPDSFAV